MNDLRKLTRIILIGLAVYILIFQALHLFVLLPYIIFGDSSTRTFDIKMVLSPLLVIIYAGLIIYLLMYKVDFFIEKIVGAEEPEQARVWWIPFAFRLTSVFAGMLYLYRVVPRIISTIHAYIFAVQHNFENPSPYLSWSVILSWVVLLALGIYLLCGAPHFVRWQVRKTLEQCKRSDEL